jgi:hypothetical protein
MLRRGSRRLRRPVRANTKVLTKSFPDLVICHCTSHKKSILFLVREYVLTCHCPSTRHLPVNVHSVLFQPSLSRKCIQLAQSELHPSCAPISSIRVPIPFPSDPFSPRISIKSLIRVHNGGYSRHHSRVSSPVPRLCHTTDLTTTVTPQNHLLCDHPFQVPPYLSCHVILCRVTVTVTLASMHTLQPDSDFVHPHVQECGSGAVTFQ